MFDQFYTARKINSDNQLARKNSAHNDDSICKINSPLFCFLVDNTNYWIYNYIYQIISERQRYFNLCVSENFLLKSECCIYKISFVLS
jgi:hypothetical protein